MSTVTLQVGDRIRLVSPHAGPWRRIESLSDHFVGVDSGMLSRRLVQDRIAQGSIEHASNHGAKVYEDLSEARSAMGAGEVVAKLTPLARWIVVPDEMYELCADVCGWERETTPMPLTRSELLAQAAWRMCDMGYGAYIRQAIESGGAEEKALTGAGCCPTASSSCTGCSPVSGPTPAPPTGAGPAGRSRRCGS